MKRKNNFKQEEENKYMQRNNNLKKKEVKLERGGKHNQYIVIHCGVVGNIQAFHVCAPGSIPGDGIFCILEKRREKREGVYFYIEEEKK